MSHFTTRIVRKADETIMVSALHALATRMEKEQDIEGVVDAMIELIAEHAACQTQFDPKSYLSKLAGSMVRHAGHVSPKCLVEAYSSYRIEVYDAQSRKQIDLIQEEDKGGVMFIPGTLTRSN